MGEHNFVATSILWPGDCYL